MDTITINGIEVEVIKTGIKKYGYNNLFELAKYPHVTEYAKRGTIVNCEAEDWVVLETDELKVYMNNLNGYIIFIEFEKSHYEVGKGLVFDKEGHIYYTIF